MNEFDFSKSTPGTEALKRDIQRAVAARSIEFDEQGRMILGQHVNVRLGGVFTSAIQRHALVQDAVASGDPEQEAWARQVVAQRGCPIAGYVLEQVGSDHNLIPNAGLNHYLDVVLGGGVQVATWYFGLFKSNWTPVAGALSNWGCPSCGGAGGALATELAAADYTESASGRPAAVFGAAAAKVKATSAPSVCTLATGVSGISLYGATLNSTATIAYTGVDKVLVAATTFTTAKTGLGATDKANVEYSITGSST